MEERGPLKTAQKTVLVGPMLFMVFIVFGMLFLLNVFIAILSEAYEDASLRFVFVPGLPHDTL